MGKQEAACFPGVGGRCNDGNVASLRLTDPEINGLPHEAAIIGRRRRPGSLASSGLDWTWKELSYANASSFRLLGRTAVTLSGRKACHYHVRLVGKALESVRKATLAILTRPVTLPTAAGGQHSCAMPPRCRARDHTSSVLRKGPRSAP